MSPPLLDSSRIIRPTTVPDPASIACPPVRHLFRPLLSGFPPLLPRPICSGGTLFVTGTRPPVSVGLHRRVIPSPPGLVSHVLQGEGKRKPTWLGLRSTRRPFRCGIYCPYAVRRDCTEGVQQSISAGRSQVPLPPRHFPGRQPR